MMKTVHWRGAGVKTLNEVRRSNRRLNHCRAGTAKVLTRMQRGASLHLPYERGQPLWRLSDGMRVAEDIARLVVADHRVRGVGDALFDGMPPQTYRYSEV
jgi:hypothetical protein